MKERRTYKIGIIASTILGLSKNVKKGTEIFVYRLIDGLTKKNQGVTLSNFASKDSQVPNLIGIQERASLSDPEIQQKGHDLFEIANIANALTHSDIDLFHMNITNGELILPFSQFVDKPILITCHFHLTGDFRKKLFSYYKNSKNLYFVSISNSQRTPLPHLNYIKTIYHGIDLLHFKYNEEKVDGIVWAGRGVPEKGLDDVMAVIKATGVNAKIFPILKSKHVDWIKKEILAKRNLLKASITVRTSFDINQSQLAEYYQQSKLFLNPIKWEEPFGLVMIEAMACGTPVVAYARGSVPEIIKDGETGFIVNSSPKNIRGKWIVKKTGIEGLIEAVKRIYSMPDKEYRQMRLNCRRHVEKHFAIERMVNEYIQVYKEVVADYQKKRSKLG